MHNVREPDLLNLGLAYTDEPDVIFCGIVPAYAANCLASLKAFMSETSAKIAIADSSPIPYTNSHYTTNRWTTMEEKP